MLEEPFGDDSCDLNMDAFNKYIRTMCSTILARHHGGGGGDAGERIKWDLALGPMDGAGPGGATSVPAALGGDPMATASFDTRAFQRELFLPHRPRGEVSLVARGEQGLRATNRWEKMPTLTM